MKLPNWFKIIWWILLLGLTGTILFKRFEAITSGQSVPVDIFVFLIFIVLMLVPIFSEIEFFGIKLKKELNQLKDDLDIKFGDIKNEIKNSQTQTVNQTFQTLGPPPPDNKLPELQDEIERILSVKFYTHGAVAVSKDAKIASRIDVPEDNLLMFQVRYNIEKQLRRIWEERFNRTEFDDRIRHIPITRIIQELSKSEIINGNFYGILREILSICNYAIHGEKVTENQISFVTKNAKQIIDYLSEIK
ncbi:hypothetical protein ACE01N_19745 [Saccharicrinis sp. FJH2]|uniref:hypothetical protein n=1 Tax=Saccharicrinis sp. FJH65 TaxID=3344659 RepID=UPI0035F3B027